MATIASANFSILARPGTDIWRKPPHADVYDAPTGLPPGSTSTSASGPLLSFLSARASFSFAWSEQYDQVGLLLVFKPLSQPASASASASASTPSSSPSPPKWIKTGIEFYNGQPMLSTVACERWADWSVSPLTSFEFDAGARTWTTISIEKGVDEHGTSLWVYQVLEGGEKVALREICWVYGDSPESWSLEVSAMAARPNKDAAAELEVEVRDMEIKWSPV